MNYFVSNKGVTNTFFPNDLILESDNLVYEVLRFINKIPLFIDEHYDRLIKTLKFRNSDFTLSLNDFKAHVSNLIDSNKLDSGNIKFVCKPDKTVSEWIFSIIPHNYPTREDYKFGVNVELLNAERINPNSKLINNNLRNTANGIISRNKLYEVLLVNRNGIITEGSKSNVFFVDNKCFYTAPSEMVLEGITRSKVIQCIKDLGYNLLEIPVSITELNCYESAFLTGTSPKVLPIAKIGDLDFDVINNKITNLIDSYNLLINRYMSNYIK